MFWKQKQKDEWKNKLNFNSYSIYEKDIKNDVADCEK